MNLFVLDRDHKKNAEYHNDKHVNKMILESAQILCSVIHNVYGGEKPAWLYRRTHANHPCVIWAGQSFANFKWVFDYCNHLHCEKIYRTRRPHKSFEVAKKCYSLLADRPLFSSVNLTEFTQCMPEKYRCDDVVSAYRSYYMNDKRHLATWSKRGEPDWWN